MKYQGKMSFWVILYFSSMIFFTSWIHISESESLKNNDRYVCLIIFKPGSQYDLISGNYLTFLRFVTKLNTKPCGHVSSMGSSFHLPQNLIVITLVWVGHRLEVTTPDIRKSSPRGKDRDYLSKIPWKKILFWA